jgi:porphobilinogen synthase
VSTFPATRLRRLRRTAPLRSLVRETTLDLDDFVMPLFVGPDTRANEELPPMGRFSVADLSGEVEELVRLGVSAVILFGIPDDKDDEGLGRLGRRRRRAARAARAPSALPELCCSPTSASASTRRTVTAA